MPIDKVRASLDGHAFHEAWASRSALELLPPKSSLTAIAIEGFSREDSETLSAGAIEIADIVRYHGASQVAQASRVEIVQFKYSIRSAEVAARGADLAKTLAKFAASDVELRQSHGDAHVEAVVRYDFATNRPIHPNLVAAIATLTGATPATDKYDAAGQTDNDVAVQAAQLVTAVEGIAVDLPSLLRRLSLTGDRGSLRESRETLRRQLADWSVAGDPQSEKRLLKLRNLVRSKAEVAAQKDNLINRVAVLAELEVDDEADLYPTPDAFPPVPLVIARPLVDQIVAAVASQKRPLVVHGAGGMGKTVLVQSIAKRLGTTDCVLLFDGFGAGKWRDPADGRHRAERTLVHLANLLAAQGLCDILLPAVDDAGLVRAFRKRLEQAVTTLRRTALEARVVLLLDAIDHAAMEARDTGTPSFAHLLLKSLAIDPINGVVAVASCRTERRTLAVGGAPHDDLEIPPFTRIETEALIRQRVPDATAAEIAALSQRSGRNPRCLDTLIGAGRPFDQPGPGDVDQSADPSALLDELLTQRIEAARSDASDRGTSDTEINILLSALSLLPPPVPLEELAAAQGFDVAQAESFATDLAPLLERTPHGLMFRDEPTETLIRRLSVAASESRRAVVERLDGRQGQSNYAARALPAVLVSLRDVDRLVALAFDDRVPPGASKVARRDIRMARILAAQRVCAAERRTDDLIRLLLEAALVGAGHERSELFLYEHPDLVAIAGDPEAARRLFATKAGWPGSRHAARAIASALTGDRPEARRNAARAIDWHNWSVRQPDRDDFMPDQERRDTCDFGFTYVETLAGHGKRMASWIARWGQKSGYDAFAALFDLAERHHCIVPDDDELNAVYDEAGACRLRHRGYWRAALRFADANDVRTRSMVRALARSEPSKGESGGDGLGLTPVATALALGLRREARLIFGQESTGPLGLHAFRSRYVYDRRVEDVVLAAGLRAALRGTPVNLLDLAPREIIDLVPKSLRARGPKTFESALKTRMTGAPAKKARKAADGHRDPQEPEHRRTALSDRIRPLIPIADFLAKLVTASPADRSTVLTAALDHLDRTISTANCYPYPDQRAYLARVGVTALFDAADAGFALGGETADRWINPIRRAELSTETLTRFVTRLSRVTSCHSAAMAVAGLAEARIRAETDTSTRITAYGKLARAVWRVDPQEAAAYFRRGLDLADAIGSDDFDKVNHLLLISGRYEGPALSHAAAHALARIIELNQHEEKKFPWLEWAESFDHSAGLGALPILSRLDDRGNVALRRSLPPMLLRLMVLGQMPSDLGIILFGLSGRSEGHRWSVADLAATALASLPRDRVEWLFDIVLVEIDRDRGLAQWPETIADLLALGAKHLAASSPSLARLRALATLVAKPEEEPTSAAPAHAMPASEAASLAIEAGDPDAIDRAIEADAEIRGHSWPRLPLSHIAQAVPRARRKAFLEALILVDGADLLDKLGALEDHLESWLALSPALKEALPDFALRFARRHPHDLIGASWETDMGWRHLTGIFGAGATDVALEVIAALGDGAQDVGGDSWLALAAHLAPAVSMAALGAGLERFLPLSDATLPDEVAGGPWTSALTPPEGALETAAGLIWSRLGAVEAGDRWRAAHALRRLAERERFDVIDAVVARFDADGGAFRDQSLPFYRMHAQLWLLIALARIARDRPSDIARYRLLLERMAFGDGPPHVLMRAFAAEALGACAKTLDPGPRADLETRLEQVNRSPFPLWTERPTGPTGRYARRPEGETRPEPHFGIDHDFGKYQAAPLGDRFGLPDYAIEDAISAVVKAWDPEVRNMFDCPRRDHLDHDRGGSTSGVPASDRYGSYLGWHGLMVAAGQYLANRPVYAYPYRERAWEEYLERFLLSRSDGYWLSDLTGLTPFDVAVPLAMPKKEDEDFLKPEDAKLLSKLLGLENGKPLARPLIVEGYWPLKDGVTIRVASILADRKAAEAAMIAAVTVEPSQTWLPATDHDLDDQVKRSRSEVLAWLREEDHGDRRLDRHDPYAAWTARHPPAPSDLTMAVFGLAPDDPRELVWRDRSELCLTAETWGGEQKGDDQEKAGERLLAEPAFLQKLLQGSGKHLVGLVKAEQYIPSSHDVEKSRFTYRAMAFTVDPAGKVRILTRLSPQMRATLATVSAYDRTEFYARYRAFRRRAGAKPVKRGAP